MSPLSLFTGPYGVLAKWGVIALLVAAFGAFSWFKGNEHGTQKLINYQGQQAIATVKLQAARVQVVHDVQTEYVDRIQKIYVKGQTIEKEVTKYVTAVDDSHCVIPAGFVREYAAAWTNTPAGPPVESDRGPSGVQLSAVAASDAGNAASCFKYKEQRDGLIEFYKRLQAVEK